MDPTMPGESMAAPLFQNPRAGGEGLPDAPIPGLASAIRAKVPVAPSSEQGGAGGNRRRWIAKGVQVHLAVAAFAACGVHHPDPLPINDGGAA